MAVLICLFLLALSATVDGTCKKRNVHVILEVGPGTNFDATIEAEGFFKSLLKKPKPGTKKCWEAKISVADPSIVRITEPTSGWAEQVSEKSPRENIVAELKAIHSGSDLQSSPKPVIVLVLHKYSFDVENLESAARDLQELGYKFLVIGVGDGWDAEKLKGIASIRTRVLIVKDLFKLDPAETPNINGLILELLNDPDKEASSRGFSSANEVIGKKCDAEVDLGFILDSSGSLINEYDQEKHFITMIAKSFGVEKGKTHAGVVTFSDRAELSIKLSKTSDYAEFHEAVYSIEHMNSITRIDLALETAKDHLFSKENGGRDGKKKVLVLLTDGSQSEGKGTDPAPIADALRQQGVELLVIGIGAQTDEVELKRIAGPRDNYRSADNFAELASTQFAKNMTTKLCDIATTEDCERIVDVCFLLDSSGSINEFTDWVKIKEFVRRIANSFKFSETGARGSIVVFSDLIDKRVAYTKVVLQLNNNLTASDFGKAVESIPYIGYRTRMDLGFKLVDEVVFQQKNGARGRNVKKVVILITDGRQNPPEHDPALASQPLWLKGTNIYAIGIGKQIDFGQLQRITRKAHRVFRADSFQSLESAEFVKSVSTTVCKNATTGPATDCCCPKIEGTLKQNLEKRLVEAVKEEMNEYCKAGCEGKGSGDSKVDAGIGIVGTPAIDSDPQKRKRRSINLNMDEEDFEELGMLMKPSKSAGCNVFLKALRKHKVFNDISKLMKERKHVSIFCPIDKAYEKLYARDKLDVNERNVLLNHIGIKESEDGKVYRTLLAGGQIRIGKRMDEVKKANGAEIIFSLADGAYGEIVVIKEMLTPTQHSLLDILKSNAEVSIFYEILSKSQLTDIFMHTEIDKICFTQDLCLDVTPVMFSKLKDTIHDQFTISAPSNRMFLNMKKTELKSLMNDPVARKEFLREHIYIGSLGNPESTNAAYSLSSKHFKVTMKMKNNAMILKHANGKIFEVKSTAPTTEGILYVVDLKE